MHLKRIALLAFVQLLVGSITSYAGQCDPREHEFNKKCYYAELDFLHTRHACAADPKKPSLIKSVCLEYQGKVSIRCDGIQMKIGEAQVAQLEKELLEHYLKRMERTGCLLDGLVKPEPEPTGSASEKLQ
ncbi:MAG: hypothetical protein AB7F86_16350 [Bdellovibrionales bacterium]